jgi:hypothetical protein
MPRTDDITGIVGATALGAVAPYDRQVPRDVEDATPISVFVTAER